MFICVTKDLMVDSQVSSIVLCLQEQLVYIAHQEIVVLSTEAGEVTRRVCKICVQKTKESRPP